MKILYFMDGFGNAGGIQEQVLNWIKYFGKNTKIDILGYYQVDVSGKRLNNEQSYIERLKKYDCNSYLIAPFRKKYFRKCLKEAKEFFRLHHDYDVIEIHGSTKCFFIMRLAKKYGIKIRIAHAHCTKFQTTNRLKIFIGCFLKKKYNKLATHYFACSNESGKWLFGDKICESDRYYIINNAVDFDKFYFSNDVREKARIELGITNEKVIIHVGRFTHQKNHIFLIDIFNSLIKKDPNYKLLLVGDSVRGDTSFKDKVVEKIEKYGLNEKVIFLGIRNDVNNLLNASDVFVFPSLYEGLCLVMIEAQATGIPCVASNTISKEVVVSHLVEFCDLSSSYDEWANVIIRQFESKKERKAPFDEIRMNNYDVKEESRKLEELYLQFTRNI